MENFDYIVVGAGTAGCVLTERLSAAGTARVLVLEAGGSDQRFWIRTPIGYGRTFADGRVNWKYQTEAIPGLGGRTMYWPRGRVVGGSSSINALVYCRGMPIDFDDWRELGNPGWGWDDVRPVFERTERRVGPDGVARSSGVLDVKEVTPHLHAIGGNWFAAARELGLPITADFNGDQPEGFGTYQVNIRDGRRFSAADAFLRPALRRHNVKLEMHAWARRILFDGRRATGVEYERGGILRTASAAREVIVCSGAVNSPQLLQLSGIGPGTLLARHGIAPLVDNTAVGGNLQDHLAVVYSYKATQPTLNDVLGSPWGQFTSGLRYLLTRGGPLSLSVNQFGGFVSADPQGTRPDMQLYFNPVTYGAGDSARTRIALDRFPGFYLCFQPTRPTSVGRVDIAAADFREPPTIQPNYLSTDKDVRDALNGAHLMRRLAQTRALRSLIKEALPPDFERLADEDLLADFRARAATVYHPVGTCRMGADARNSVVDPSLAVHGVERLRVVDASVFPTVTSANTNAPTYMVAQRAADILLGS